MQVITCAYADCTDPVLIAAVLLSAPWFIHPGRADLCVQGPNVWPAEGTISGEARLTMERFYTRMVQMAEVVVRGLSLAMGQVDGV